MNVRILVANASHTGFAERICELMYISALERGTGIARRSPEYIVEKMISNKAVIALDGRNLVGFSYIETWSHKSFVANSGLIVDHAYRHLGIASRIKKRIFLLSREMYPKAKIFGITTGAAVMKINSKLGYRPVPFSELTQTKLSGRDAGCGIMTSSSETKAYVSVHRNVIRSGRSSKRKIANGIHQKTEHNTP